MNEFTIRTPAQLTTIIRSFRKNAGFSQSELAKRLGVRQQTLSALERNAEHVSAKRLMRLLSVLQIELVLRTTEPQLPSETATDATEW